MKNMPMWLGSTGMIGKVLICAAVTAPLWKVSTGAAQNVTEEVVVEQQSSVTYSINEDGRRVSVEMRDGEVVGATVDGASVPLDRVEKTESRLIVHDEDGGVIAEIPVAKHGAELFFDATMEPDLDEMKRALEELRSQMYVLGPEGAIQVLEVEPEEGWVLRREPMERDLSVLVERAGPAPKVMVGVQMGTPDEALAAHLDVEPDEVTLLSAVYPEMPAAKAGLERFDVITRINGEAPASPEALRKALQEKEPGDTLALTVIHRGKARVVELELAPMDAGALAEAGGAAALSPRTKSLPGPLPAVPRAPNAPIVIAPEQGGMWWGALPEPRLVPPPAPSAAEGALEERLERIEDKLDRLESLLDELVEGARP